MRNDLQYQRYERPRWAPPSWLFAPVWTVLYIIIAITYLYVGYAYIIGNLPLFVFVPFVLNLMFNIAYTPLQFRLRSFSLATIDIFLVLATLVWELVAIFPYDAWISYANLPYLAWVSFATVLQITVTFLNKKSA